MTYSQEACEERGTTSPHVWPALFPSVFRLLPLHLPLCRTPSLKLLPREKNGTREGNDDLGTGIPALAPRAVPQAGADSSAR